MTGWLIAGIAVAVAVALGVAVSRTRARLGRSEAALAAARAVVTPPEGQPLARAVAGLVARAGAAEARLRFVEDAVDASPIGLMVLGATLEVDYSSRAASELVDQTESGRTTLARVRTAAGKVLAGGEPVEEVVEVFGRRRRVLWMRVSPLTGATAKAVAVELLDVTERDQLEAMRRDFVANVSHELKTPVGALTVLAEALADADDPVTRRRLADRVEAEAARMSNLVRDLLSLSRLESEVPAIESVDLRDVVAEATRRVGVLADAAGVDVRTEVPPRPLVVAADRHQVTSAVSNLLDNAVAHSLPGNGAAEVVVRARRDGGEVVVEVEDHGVGIPADDQDRIFERFYRVDRGRTRAQGGTGLGLAIVRHVAIGHGGTVEVDSAPGAGATFRLRIPAGGP